MSLEILDRGTAAASRPNTDWQSCAFPQICVLPSGRWICCYRAAPEKGSATNQLPPFGNQARVSEDHGRTWSQPMTISADGAGGDLGYPSTVQLADGTLLTVWYESGLKGYPRAVLRQAHWAIKDK